MCVINEELAEKGCFLKQNVSPLRSIEQIIRLASADRSGTFKEEGGEWRGEKRWEILISITNAGGM